MRQLQDNQLITKLQDGDLEALGFLYDRPRQMVYRTALAITGDPEVAADLLQEVFLRLHRFAHRIDTERPLAPWLYRVTANLAYSWMKRRNHLTSCLKEMEEWLSRERRTTPDQLGENKETSFYGL